MHTDFLFQLCANNIYKLMKMRQSSSLLKHLKNWGTFSAIQRFSIAAGISEVSLKNLES
jgi:hypothetical protein